MGDLQRPAERSPKLIGERAAALRLGTPVRRHRVVRAGERRHPAVRTSSSPATD